LDFLISRIALFVETRERPLEYRPANGLARLSFAHNHDRVSRVLRFVELNNFVNGIGCNLKVFSSKFFFNGSFELLKVETKMSYVDLA
jgi:hypothetical protein